MSAVQKCVSSTVPSLHFLQMQATDLAEVLLIEEDVYPYPWTRGNFLDALSSNYETWTLRDQSQSLVGYFLLMCAVDEAHLLNITVSRLWQGNGIGRMQLDKVITLARQFGMTSVLLEVRPSNQRALAMYMRYGFIQIGYRKGYYPAVDNTREDAIVMRFML